MNFVQNLILKKILVAPLDWGLGHATRCIPLIKQLQKNGCIVTIAASGSVKTLLENEFPGISIIPLHGYNIQYSNTKRFLAIKILMQAPKIARSIRREQAWLKKVLAENNFDAVISDNRFGLYTTKIPCIFITHQLLIQAPFAWLDKLIQLINYRFINRYTMCWVPDFEDGKTITGRLSHPATLPGIPVKYLGPLSRFDYIQPLPLKYSWMIILSGPEPQRTILEKKLLAVIHKLEGNVLLVRGKPGSTESIDAPQNCTVANHLGTTQMQEAIAESGFIVSRCGYTTIMEMLSLYKKCVFIPTPGQTEQEYLAEHLAGQGWCYYCQQNEDLDLHLYSAKTFYNFQLPVLPKAKLEEVVTGFLSLLEK
ncbi:MAG TPA: glycosyltransferase [Chitinophagaceae bacterium]|nr:glycosyltransferase [Chitinophagaceae bacterium]